MFYMNDHSVRKRELTAPDILGQLPRKIVMLEAACFVGFTPSFFLLGLTTIVLAPIVK